MRELCCSIVSAVVFRSLFLLAIFQFGVVGATLGAMAGAVIGCSNKMRFTEGVIVGAVSGTALSYNLIKASYDHLLSDDADEMVFLVHLVKLITGALEKILGHDEYKIMGSNKQEPFGKGYSLANFVKSWKH
ncbi:hypothetical protein L2E82_07859 [Cichorium intybus]|uniref:Uncharacterized protein n=1 Tax=Cichorium intybus TaxID=13427 RepID=A0ACB9G5L1_CICIN|nr:hypothetical protein L2E82_07859 [Cichorium intybus]